MLHLCARKNLFSYKVSITSTLLAAVLFLATTTATGAQAAEEFNRAKFTQTIYSALDMIHVSHAPSKYRDASAFLMTARQMTDNGDQRARVEKALSLLNGYDHLLADVPDTTALDALLEQCLRANRVQITRSFEDEYNLVLNLFKTQYLGETGREVQVIFQNVQTDRAMAELMAFMADPRAAIYEEDIRTLITNTPTLGDPRKPYITFMATAGVFELSPAMAAKSAIGARIESAINTSIPAQVPVRAHVRVLGNKLTMTIEVLGFQHIGWLEDKLHDFLALGRGNRYIKGFGDLMYQGAEYADSASFFGQTYLQSGAKMAAQAMRGAGSMVRSKLFSAGWYDPSPGMAKQELLKRAADRAADLAGERDAELAAMRAKGALQADIDARTAEYAQKIADTTAQAETQAQTIDRAVAAVEASPDFAKLSEMGKASARLKAADEAIGRKLPHFSYDVALKLVSGAVGTYYLTEGAIQYFRTDDSELRTKIRNEYGIKAASNFLYATPALEVIVAIDVTSFVFNQSVGRMTDLKLPNTEKILNAVVVTGAQDLGYRAAGSTRFRTLALELENQFGVTPLLQMRDGRWIDAASARAAQAKRHFEAGTITAEQYEQARLVYRDYLKGFARRQLLVLYYLKSIQDVTPSREFLEYENDLDDKLFTKDTSYLK